ncbi:hypothetical protein HK105_200030 [Polyrhizophydium stewartii]|uniref:Uncharacterized protein n=1 Tax=Polyrhizophydium stewartii TaxID=2732419 RepID=A0ABR4NKG9_9FUNG|nr:hypothetical protein HK105_002455 [Polyrhizophydium stewartii]
MATYTASLSTVTSVFSAIVVFGAGTALTNAKNPHQALAVAVASAAFLVQRMLFMVLAETIPNLDCFLVNDISYAALVVLRLAIMGGLYLRAAGSNRIYKSAVLTAVTIIGLIIGFVSVGALIYLAIFSPYAPGTCFQNLSRFLTLTSNLSFLISLTLLTIVVSIPIFKALSNAATTGSGGMSRVHNQARVLSRFILVIPVVLICALTVMAFLSADNANMFIFMSSLIFSDFCQIWLLLFPMIVMAGDNGDSFGAGSGSNGPTSVRSPITPSTHQRPTIQQELQTHPEKFFTQSTFGHSEIPF